MSRRRRSHQVWADYRKIEDVPSGATLATDDKSGVGARAKPLVCVVSRAEEASGLMYDRCGNSSRRKRHSME